MTSPGRLAKLSLTALIVLLLAAPSALATPEFSKQTGMECVTCHVDVIGGGKLTLAGEKYLDDLRARGQYRRLSPVQHTLRLIIGYLHTMAAIVWFGTIMYVHILLKPAYASKGLPKGELRLGWLSMIVIAVTGTLLTIARIPSLHTFYTTRFGILLSIKIFLFLIMLSSALVVTLYIGPRMRRKLKSPVAPLASRNITAEQLSHFDGKEGRAARIAYKGIIYDLTGSRLWKNGMHVMKHAAGNDLTDVLKTAPHGEDKVLAMPRTGMLVAGDRDSRRPFHERLFYFFAYMNLVLVFIIVFVISLWRWW